MRLEARNADRRKVDGIHDIHMNQGNPANNMVGIMGFGRMGRCLFIAVEGDVDGGVYCVSDGELDDGFGWEIRFRGFCPAGRAHCAWGGHFVAGIPCRGSMMSVVLPLVGMRACLTCGQDAVGDGGGFDGGADVVDAEDVGSGEDGGYVGGGGGVERSPWRCAAVEKDDVDGF